MMLKTKKGMGAIWILVILVVLIAGGFAYKGYVGGGSSTNSLSGGIIPPEMDFSITDTNGVLDVSETAIGSNRFQIIIPESALDSSELTDINFTIDGTVVDAMYLVEAGDYAKYSLRYGGSAEQFSNKDDSSDTNDPYDPLDYTSDELGYNVTIGTVDNAFQNAVVDSITLGDDSSMAVTMSVEDSTTLVKGIDKQYGLLKVGAIDAKIGAESMFSAEVFVRQTSAQS